MFRRSVSCIGLLNKWSSLAQRDCLTVVPMLQQTVGFKSHLSIDKIYPDSNPDILRNGSQAAPEPAETFTGYIPIDSLQITATRSSGPGGQNVNKVNSKVEIRFHLQSASWLPEDVKSRLQEKESGRITKDGYFVVRSDATRKQLLNRADCMDKIRYLIFQAAQTPKGPSEEDIKKKEERMAKAKAGMLREKRSRSLIKNSRSANHF